MANKTRANPEPIRRAARDLAWADPLTETGDEDGQNFDRAEIRAQEAIMREEQEAEIDRAIASEEVAR